MVEEVEQESPELQARAGCTNSVGAGKPRGVGRLEITLPWPPSVNSYWRSFRGRLILSKVGREYQKVVSNLYSQEPITSPIRVTIKAYRPDNRKRDLDNLLKASLDGMVHGGLFVDDSQIVDLRIFWADIIGGMLKVEIECVDETRTGFSPEDRKANVKKRQSKKNPRKKTSDI